MTRPTTPWLLPVTLEHAVVRLEPLTTAHLVQLSQAVGDEEIWRFMSCGSLAEPQRLAAWADGVWADERGSLAFAVTHRHSGDILGSTGFLEADGANLRVEIGRTFLSSSVWRSSVNTACKRLLLGHAFDVLGCRRVQFKTDLRNVRSQRAIERLGAQKEGVLRAHVVLPDGGRRDSVMYSVIAQEWPEVRARLDAFLVR